MITLYYQENTFEIMNDIGTSTSIFFNDFLDLEKNCNDHINCNKG